MKISVLTPSYNSGQYIERAIQSVLNQSYKNWEHIIFDGGSTDETVKILEKYNHLQWVSEPDRGQTDAMNKGFARCTGDIIVYLNADDYFHEGIFDLVISDFEKDQETDIVTGNVELFIEESGSRVILNSSIDFPEIAALFNFDFPANPVGYFYKKHVQEKIGPFPVDNHLTMDYWFLLRAYSDFKSVKNEAVFGVFYISGQNKSGDAEKSYLNACLTLYDYMINLEQKKQEEVFIMIMMAARKIQQKNTVAVSQVLNLESIISKVENNPFYRIYSKIKNSLKPKL